MSLELAAQHLASRGRKGDTMLVHMAPQEVSGLQALAKAGGGTLTLNPDTGLPEANFLKRMLPMIIGAGLSVASGGTLTPMMAAMMTGGGYGVATGSLRKGLMAGLGAYGGAGLAGGLSAAGTAAAGGESLAGATGTVNPLAGMEAAALENAAVAPAAGVQVGAPIVDGANLSQTGPNLFGPPATSSSAINGLTFGAENVAPINAANIAPTVTPAPQADFLSGMDRAALENKAVSGFNPANTGSLENAQRGLSGLMNNPASRDAFMTKMGGGAGLLKTGMMAAAPMLMGEEPDPYKGGGPNPYEYSYDYKTGSYTRQAPGYRSTQTVTPPRAMAAGGPIEEMSNQNRAETMMVNGGQMLAEGGITGSGNLNLNIPLDLGGGGGGGGGYTPMGGGFGGLGGALRNLGGNQMAAPSVMPSKNPFGEALLSGMGGTKENGYTSPGGNGSTAGGLMEQLQQMQKDQANSTYGGGMGGSNATPLAHVLQPSENRLGSLGRKHPSEYTLEETLRAQQSRFAQGGMASMARGGPSHLGDYSDGGRLLKGPGDGVSDSIPATIANKRPARLADGEFVVPARIVSELGNGSTEAGARKLYAMMDRVQKARKKSIGKNRVAVNSRAEKLLPA